MNAHIVRVMNLSKTAQYTYKYLSIAFDNTRGQDSKLPMFRHVRKAPVAWILIIFKTIVMPSINFPHNLENHCYAFY
jgi:hypothetical protein